MNYISLLPLMEKKGCSVSPEEFQQRVNVIFHDHEAVLYDKMHADMKNSLQEQVDLLIADLVNKKRNFDRNVHVLDIGCGTGLSTEFLLNSILNPHVKRVTLLDTSNKMLQMAEQKAKTWNREYQILNSYLSDVTEKFDLVLICSVLHHIPDLNSFLKEVDRVLKPGGFLIHLQDPNLDYLNDDNYLQRLNLYARKSNPDFAKKQWVTYIPKSIRYRIKRILGRKNYIDLINDQLIREKVIRRKMTAAEIWSVTDIHVSSDDSLPKGISFQFLADHLENFSLVNRRSYGFFGRLKSDLSEKFKKEEERFIAENRLDGRNLSAVWVKH